ncbi:MAG: hypothetical protein JO222_12145, partial [Frankiales bacterium]|nr:hypothetical protein [Frankiales bacterium]
MPTFRPLSRGATAAAAAAVVVIAASGAVLAVKELGSSGGGRTGNVAVTSLAQRPVLHLPRLVHGRVPWEHPLVLRVVRGSLTSVALIDRAGTVIDGHVESSGTRWVSEGRLQPLQSYVLRAMVREVTGATVPRSLTFRTTNASRHLTALLSPGDGNVVGVGSPVIVRLSRPVPANQRAVVEHRLAVSTQPYVVGAWHWITPQELHWRP